MFRYIEVNDSTPSMAQYNKYEQQTKSDCGDDQKVDARHFGKMILDEGFPRLGRRFRILAKEKPRHAPFGDVYTQHQQPADTLDTATQKRRSSFLIVGLA